MLSMNDKLDEGYWIKRRYRLSFSFNPNRCQQHIQMNNSIQARLDSAQNLLRQRKLGPARTIVKEVLSQNPESIAALLMFAEIRLHSGNPIGAVEVIERLFEMDIASFQSSYQLALANLCFGAELFFKAAELFGLLKDKGEAGPRSLYQLGIAYSRIGELEYAEENLLACIDLSPGVADPYLQSGHIHKALGDVEKAAGRYKKFITLSPANKGAGYWCLADLKSYRFSDDEVQIIKKEVQSVEERSLQASSLHFALGKAAEQRRNYGQAFDHYRKGNQVQAVLKPFLAKQFGQLISDLKNISGEVPPEKINDELTPVFIVGLPRSGSTLIEQILSANSRVQATDELPFLPRMAWQLGMKGGYAERLKLLSTNERKAFRHHYMDSVKPYLKKTNGYFIDKNPGNFLHIGLIKRIMPNAIIIDSRRDPRDNAVSAYRQMFHIGNEFSSSLEGFYQYYKSYLDLMAHWQAVYSGQIKTVQYEQLVTNPDTEIRSLLNFCTLEEEQACFEFYKNKRAVMTPSVGQVNQPMYTSSIGQWRHYDEFAGDEMIQLKSLMAANNDA